MCWLVHKPAGEVIPEEYILRAWELNNHGGGVVNVRTDEVFRSLDLDELLNVLDENEAMVFHIRNATSGAIDEKRLHPFNVNNYQYGEENFKWQNQNTENTSLHNRGKTLRYQNGQVIFHRKEAPVCFTWTVMLSLGPFIRKLYGSGPRTKRMTAARIPIHMIVMK